MIRLIFLTIFSNCFICAAQNEPVALPIEVGEDLPNLYEALLNEKETLLLLEVSLPNEAARKAHFFVVDLQNYTLKCSFKSNRWTYLSDAYFYKDSTLYMTYGIKLREKYRIYDIFTGERIKKQISRKSPYGEFYKAKYLHIKSDSKLMDADTIRLDHCSVHINDYPAQIIIRPK